MDGATALGLFQSRGINLAVSDGNLVVDHDGVLTDADRDLIRAYKPALVALLAGVGSTHDGPPARIGPGVVTIAEVAAGEPAGLDKGESGLEADATDSTAGSPVSAVTGSPLRNGPRCLDWEIVKGDCVNVLSRMAPGSARLLFCDPPYNIGIDYGGHHDDRMKPDDYLAWC